MPPETNGDVAVVKPYYAIEAAYNDGYAAFEAHSDEYPDEDDMDAPDEIGEAIANFKQYAQWANNTAPDLRARAGYADHGYGTYQDHRQVAAVQPGCEEDDPAEADLVDAHDVYQTLVEAWDTGAMDALLGNDRNLDRAPSW